MKLLVFGGALRKDSSNKKLAREALRLAKELGAEGEFLDLKDYPVPPYDGDIEDSVGIPENTKKMGQKIAAADALIISSPEYNGSIPGVLKNVIDWLSREKPMTLGDKPLLLITASSGAFGGLRCLWHSRQTYEVLGMHVYPGGLGVPDSLNAFDENGKLKDGKIEKRLKDLIGKFMKRVV